MQRNQLDLLIECLEGRDHHSELQIWNYELKAKSTSQVKSKAKQQSNAPNQRGYNNINTAKLPESIKKRGNEIS